MKSAAASIAKTGGRHTFIPNKPARRAPEPIPSVAIEILMSSARRAFRPESSINSAISCVDCILT